MIKSRHMYFVIATMALGYTSTASAVQLSDVNGHWGHIGVAADEVPCAACSPKTASDFGEENTNAWKEWWAGFLDDTAGEHEQFSCAWGAENDNAGGDINNYIFPIGTVSELYNGKSYECTASGWVLRGSNGTFTRHNGTIYGGVNCLYMEEGDYYQCPSCSSVSCDEGYYGNPTGCSVRESDCSKCPVSTYRTSIGGSGNYTCTTILQPGQSVAGQNSTISDCEIPRLLGGSAGSYCNDNGFFIWDSACSYAG